MAGITIEQCKTKGHELLARAVQSMIDSDEFSIETVSAELALSMAKQVKGYMESCETSHSIYTNAFTVKLLRVFRECIDASRMRKNPEKIKLDRMWSKYHQLRTSDHYTKIWEDFVRHTTGHKGCAVFCQHVGHFMFKEVVKEHHPTAAVKPPHSVSDDDVLLTTMEINGLRYAAGFVPRALKKKLSKSAHPNKDDLLLCLFNLLDDGDEDHDSSQQWIDAIDRGGLTHINHLTFELFKAMEFHVRKELITTDHHRVNFHDIQRTMLENEDILFQWDLIDVEGEEDISYELLKLITEMWTTIRGFSYTSAWLEKYKKTQHRGVQKSKGIRKQLIPKPSDSINIEKS